MDWVVVAGVAALVAIVCAIVGPAVSYGVLRNKVANVTARQNKADDRMDKLDNAIDQATKIGAQVDLLRQSTESQHTLLRTEANAAQNLMTAKLDVVAAEVRSFMHGQASMGQLRAAAKPRQG